MILPYQEIKTLCKHCLMITPYFEKQVFKGFSYGLSESGYDIRIGQDVVLYPITLWNLFLKTLGFKRPSCILASCIEEFKIPPNIMAFVADKSTWARLFLAVQNTCIEPGFKGGLTLELTNHSDKIIRIKTGTPIAQIVFHQLTAATEKPYAGKYQFQSRNPVPAKFGYN